MGKVPWLEVFSVRNGVRHLLGAGAGLLATPLIAAGLLYVAGGRALAPWMAAVALGATMVLVGVLAGSRVSPIGSLLPGLALAAVAGLAYVPGVSVAGLLPAEYAEPYAGLAGTWALPVACVLLAASVFPARWRAAVRPEPQAEPEEEVPEPPPLPKRIPSRY
ncbi:hypothetical protein [Nonomuraea gerenzanensis]|uniref:Uncharacterized protein n=1 Tax=Nonomuraea gerenzanensis TaxID=93944 RepID=A0A1M4DXS9_9ACTN|nr:hypothetical protein [Nonomuraea gerenzanensis]UBU13673.1 hypothetical protein LCN96_01140 [Nonomuraea gerenzanensis]SBO91340.1 hypothetical protein BN4615_P854 [Nonomuraea gerenzanensis]